MLWNMKSILAVSLAALLGATGIMPVWGPHPRPPVVVSPSSATSTYRSPADWLAYFRSLPQQADHRVLTGQHLPEWESAADGSADYARGQAILGTTVLVGADDYLGNQAGLADRMTAQLNAGGVVLLDFHPANPTAKAGSRNISTAWVADANAAKPSLSALYTSAAASATRTAWWAEVDRLVAFLNRLPAGATVIFRPFHESNGAYFWWGMDHTMANATRSAQLVQLTTDLKAYVTARTKVNILWMHSCNSLDWDAPCSFGRPSWVDLVGASLYSDTLTMPNKFSQTYASLVATGKPVLFGELGPSDTHQQLGTWDDRLIINTIRSTYPAVVGWQGWQENGDDVLLSPVDNQHFADLMADPWSVTLASLPH
jgi:mannan endo-1,4-beta-mannosidase